MTDGGSLLYGPLHVLRYGLSDNMTVQHKTGGREGMSHKDLEGGHSGRRKRPMQSGAHLEKENHGASEAGTQ